MHFFSSNPSVSCLVADACRGTERSLGSQKHRLTLEALLTARMDDMKDLPHRLDEIRSLEEALHRPEVRRSREAVEGLLAEGFVEFGSSGTIYQREQIIDLLAQEDGTE